MTDAASSSRTGRIKNVATNGNGIKKKRRKKIWRGIFAREANIFVLIQKWKGWWTLVCIGRTGHRVDNGNLAEVLLMTKFFAHFVQFLFQIARGWAFCYLSGCLRGVTMDSASNWNNGAMWRPGLFVMFQSDGCLENFCLLAIVPTKPSHPLNTSPNR